MKSRDTKLKEFAKTKPESQTVIIEDVEQKILQKNLTLTIKFKLTPICYGLCSHLKAILYFEGQRLKTFYASVPKTMKDLKKALKIEIFTKFG